MYCGKHALFRILAVECTTFLKWYNGRLVSPVFLFVLYGLACKKSTYTDCCGS